MKSEVHAASLPEVDGRSPHTAWNKAIRRSRSATWVRTKAAAALIGATGMFAYAPSAEAQSCLHCGTSTDQSSCTTSGSWGYGCVPGFVLADNNDNGAASVSMTLGANSLQLLQTINSSGCCVAPYANIGIFDGCQASDQWAQPGSHLPLQLKDIGLLKGAWTFQVPLPLKANEQYRIYYEMFLSTTAAGHADGGNLTAVLFWSNFSFDATTGHAPINGSQGMDVIDYHGQVGQGQGPFVDFLYPKGMYAPDANGVVTVPSVDIKAVIDWAVTNFPNYYTNDLYLSHLSLAVEAGAFKGTVTTSYASFAVQKSGSSTVYTPPFTVDHWSSCSTAADCDDGDPCTTDTCASSQCSNVAVAGCSDAGASSVSDAGSSSSASSSRSSGGSSSGSSSRSSGGGRGDAGAGAGSSVGQAPENALHNGEAGAGGDGFADASDGSKGCATAAAGSRPGAFGALWLLGLAAIARRRSRGTRGASADR
jgi:MYXO-CTERM domain-containing protein